ncbi:hypothetical protein [Kineococcus arenarius]|uniref:hypothetical protein n=1 Tax=Kineococcus sp. SYSU DK007 TaxID=3383128 RepID=UPI003D7E8647
MSVDYTEPLDAEERDALDDAEAQLLAEESFFDCAHEEGTRCPGACSQGFYNVRTSCDWHQGVHWRRGAEVIDGFCHSCDAGWVHAHSVRRLPAPQHTRAILRAWDRELREYIGS